MTKEKTPLRKFTDNEGESLILFHRHFGWCGLCNGKVRMVARCHVTYDYMKSHDDGENDIA